MPRIAKPKGAARRTRSDSHVTAAKLVGAKNPKPPPGVHLPKEAQEPFRRIVGTRAPDAWTLVDLEHAVELACCFADMAAARAELRREGEIVENAQGTPIINPRRKLLEDISRRSIALSRLLHVHPQATQGPSGEQAKRNSTSRKVRDAAGSPAGGWDDDEDDLIARH